MIPAAAEDAAPCERDAFAAPCGSSRIDGWVAFHRLASGRHVRQCERDADFVPLTRSRIRVIEVKSKIFVCRRIPAADDCGSKASKLIGLMIASEIDSGDFSDLT
ncbi:hypothetical protein [Microbacterium arborescens]|uniref:hypothetical protein n=1 Tax=Microbacterium arborescens TaxID=33883 RepID=UPI00278B02A6|nr:hypothetical protein [Microbacterium arborescens]MDQ1215818.1 hypothetical protein [Microbacterium arborescens]